MSPLWLDHQLFCSSSMHGIGTGLCVCDPKQQVGHLLDPAAMSGIQPSHLVPDLVLCFAICGRWRCFLVFYFLFERNFSCFFFSFRRRKTRLDIFALEICQLLLANLIVLNRPSRPGCHRRPPFGVEPGFSLKPKHARFGIRARLLFRFHDTKRQITDHPALPLSLLHCTTVPACGGFPPCICVAVLRHASLPLAFAATGSDPAGDRTPRPPRYACPPPFSSPSPRAKSSTTVC